MRTTEEYQEALEKMNSFTFEWADCSEEKKLLQELIDTYKENNEK